MKKNDRYFVKISFFINGVKPPLTYWNICEGFATKKEAESHKHIIDDTVARAELYDIVTKKTEIWKQ